MLTLGPPLPKALENLSVLEIHGDAYVFGGAGKSYYVNSAIYQITCSSGICSWSTLNQELKVARYSSVAIGVPDNFFLEEGTTTTKTGIRLLENPVSVVLRVSRI